MTNFKETETANVLFLLVIYVDKLIRVRVSYLQWVTRVCKTFPLFGNEIACVFKSTQIWSLTFVRIVGPVPGRGCLGSGCFDMGM